jgi:hypothetical protein
MAGNVDVTGAGFDMGSFVFSTFAGLRGAVSLILAQQLVLDQGQYPHEARVIAEVSPLKSPVDGCHHCRVTCSTAWAEPFVHSGVTSFARTLATFSCSSGVLSEPVYKHAAC